MSSSSRPTSVTVSLPTKDRRAFHNACRRLRRIMGVLAPTLAALCAHNLRGREATGLVEDYLAAIGWPPPVLRAGARRAAVSGRRVMPIRPGLPRPEIDPLRN